MTLPLLIDDHLLARHLTATPPRELARSRRPIATTGLWYHRLARAVAASPVGGTLSREVGDRSGLLGERLASTLTRLPENIEVVSLRHLAQPMAQLVASGHRRNLLCLEVLAAAQYLGADIWLSAANNAGPLLESANELGIRVRVLEQ